MSNTTASLSPCGQESLKHSGFLCFLSTGGQPIIIGETDGTKTLARATDVFTGHIDPNFKDWGLDVPNGAKPATPVEVHELVKDGCFSQFFPTLGALDQLCLTQAQIEKFCLEHRRWLRKDGNVTLFLFKVEDWFFVVRVNFDNRDRLEVRVRSFLYDHVWFASYKHRLVVPCLLAGQTAQLTV